MAWIYLFAAIVAEVAGTSALKASEGFTKLGPSAIVITGYGISFYLLSLTLETIPVGLAYAIWSGVGIVLITMIGWILFGQSLNIPAMIGIGLIMAGVVVIYLMSDAQVH